MAPIRYSLHYEDYSEHLMSRFGILLQMQSLVDMTLMCSSHTLRVHKAVLAASSAYFQEVLQKQTGEPLIILKMRFSVLKCLVEFMYCGKTQCLEENLDELVSAAQFLKIKGLSKVTKEGLGIANNSEMPVFTPPVVINRPPQSLIDLHSQESDSKTQQPSQLAPATSTGQPVDNLVRMNKDMVVRIPFDIENGGTTTTVDYPDAPRAIKPRRGRPSVRRPGAWEGTGSLGRAAERALLRREQDSRKAIHQLKHLQTRHMQDYMDRVTLSQAVNSICGPESSTNYMNIDNDLMYMDQTVSSNVLDPTISYNKEHSIGNETITSYSNNNPISSAESSTTGISTAMSQYVNALKNAGLPTDLPILFESGDGSYINVNEQVLLDMVQSSEIQYEVIEQPNIIEKVADPSEIKSIDDLSKSIERGEMLLGNKGYGSNSDYDKDSSQYNRTEDTINSLNAILPDNLESFEEQQNYVVLDPRLQENNNSIDHVNAHDFSCIDGDMQFFTKSMSDDVKKYYEDQQLHDARVIEQLCPASTSLDTNFSISLLDTKTSHLSSNLSQQYNPLNPEDLRRNEDCYDFGLQLPQSAVFKEDALDCLMSTPKRNDDDQNNYEDSAQLDQRAQERDEIIKDLMNIENKMNMAQKHNSSKDDQDNLNPNPDSNVQDFNVSTLNVSNVFDNDSDNMKELNNSKSSNGDISATITSSGLQWDNLDISKKTHEDNEDTVTNEHRAGNESQIDTMASESRYQESVIDLTGPVKVEGGQWADMINENDDLNKENEQPNTNDDKINSTLENNIPYAVGLLPLKQVQPTEEGSLLKRKNSIDVDLLDNVDAKCLKRKVKYKKL
ncbi:unnamed protein product [Spodoptera littoralis]|uniref:BTB domain-containing protein n=1 Tax=Spodoptera littoralis TaxID=7109 RepID=A0A9P0NBM7_SPOLI|nr:unnamed protein product [Spodoptera littoralis]CAH1646979.1 unnamed protein product [Spodoptera littoralis]